MSKQLDTASAPGAKSELELFSVPPTQVSVQAGYWCGYRLNNPINNSGPYRFVIPQENYMLDLSKNYVYVKLRILKDDGTNLTTDKVGPINALGKTLFQRCIVKLGDKEIYNSGSLYGYQSYLETLLNFGKEAKITQQQLALFYKDNCEAFDNYDENLGLKARASRCSNSKYVEIMAPLNSELFLQDRYLISQCSVTIELFRNPDNFVLMSPDVINYKLDIADMRFYVYKVKVQDSLALSIDRILLEKRLTAKYPIRRARVLNRRIPKGTLSITESHLFNGQLPRRLLFAMVPSKAFNGDYKLNPFNFKHCNLSEVSVWIGDRQVPSEPLRMNFETDEYALPYLYLMEGCGIANSDKSNDITYRDFKGGNAVFVFELTPDHLDSGNLQLLEEGTVRINLTFSKAIEEEEGVELIVYGEFDNIISIDYNRTVFTDY